MSHAPDSGLAHVIEPIASHPYQLKFETVSGSGEDLQMRSLLDRQQFHDPLGEAEREGISSSAWPIFGLLWPSGRVLAHAMLTYELEGKRILELGCGLALASLVVHRRGGNITASDCHPLAADFLRENLKLNHLPVMKYQTGNWSRANPLLARFDLIIGSDVLYDRDQPEALSQFIGLHTQPDAEVLIVDPDRGNRASFNRKMDAMGYARSETLISTLPGGATKYKGRLLRYRKSAGACMAKAGPGPLGV
ncbi:Lysine methyltransferase [Polaromonas sp. OV174]|uniref:class I SAM-dependent methyltransferase n=1 Tax=Polaromonas sp. OV174 TaxID=1855300 RepID=UPI0008F39F97|nr:methyltransferase domain-containing protein [Polaromonas sp. OV174]SFC61944.1 Lysine methyltransferase [Polaromonas sp. OV174]